jgi:DNA-binding protein HU-beta
MNKSESMLCCRRRNYKAAAKLALEIILGNVSGDRWKSIASRFWIMVSFRKSSRDGRNPQTGKTIQIAAKNVVKFKAGAELEGKLIVSFKPIIIKPSLWKVF